MVAAGRRFTGVDSSWWRMEEATNQMTITAVLVLDRPVDEERLRALLQYRLLVHERFRECVVEGGPGRPRWLARQDFRLTDHLTTTSLPEPGGRLQLEALVGREMSRPLDPRQPLWRMLHVPRYDGGCALIVRIHHCIADGLALVHLLLELDSDDALGARSYWGPSVVRVGRIDSNGHSPGTLAAAFARGTLAAGSLCRLAGLRPDPDCALRGKLGAEKRAAWSTAFSLEQLRQVARRTGATLNDLFVASVAGGVGQFLGERGERVGRCVRAVIPVNLRRESEERALGNRFGLVFASLPVWVADPVERLREVSRTMQRLKRSPEAGAVFGLLEFFGRTPRAALGIAVSLLGSKASLIFTNVPGPRQRIRFCGAEVEELIAWVPQSGRLGLGASALSYADDLRFGIAADARLVPDPRALVACCERAAGELLERVLPTCGRT